MNAYTLTQASALALCEALQTSKTVKLELKRPATVAWATLCVEQAGAKLDAVITYGPTLNSITLQAGDNANTHHLTDFIESIVNGTVDTAMASPPTLTAQPILDDRQTENLRAICNQGGFLQLHVNQTTPVQIAVHRTHTRPGITVICSAVGSPSRTTCFTCYEPPAVAYAHVKDSVLKLASNKAA